MDGEIKEFVRYMAEVKQASQNTLISYERDLNQMAEYLRERGIADVSRVTKTALNSYILFLEKSGKASSTISRVMASMRAFFHYEIREGKLRKDPSEMLKTPKVEKKAPSILTVEQVEDLLAQPGDSTPKEMRDKAMLELLYATGLRVSELIGLTVEDINLPIGFVTCREGYRQRTVPFGKTAKQALKKYMEQARGALVKEKEVPYLFVNCSGGPMSRQGFWKIVKYYGGKAGIGTDITPHTLRHSLAVHLIGGGADLQAVQTMLGHADPATTQAYIGYARMQEPVRKSYREAHPRK